MQNKIAGLCGVLGLAALALPLPATAGGAGPSSIEKSLIGVRMLQSYKDVLRKLGPPTRVYRNDETVGLIEAYDSKGNPTGGILGFSDSLAALGGGQTGGGVPGGMRGMMPGGGPPGMPGMAGSMGGGKFGMMAGGGPPGMPGGMRGMMPGMAGGGPPGYPGARGGMMPGMAGGKFGMMAGGGPPGFPGAPGGMRGAGFGGGTTGTTAGNEGEGPSPRIGTYVGGETFEDAGGFKWVYLYPKQQLLNEFIFNRDGRVEIILERGRNLGAPTSRGVRLGSSERAVLDTYGWPDSIEDEGISFGFSYIQKHHVEFTITRHKVTGIAVFLREDQRIRFLQNSTQMAGQTGGRPGMPGGMLGANMGAPGGMRGMMPGMAGGAAGGIRRPGFAGGGGVGKGGGAGMGGAE